MAFKGIISGFYAVAALANIAPVAKKREPVSPLIVAVGIVTHAAIIMLWIYWAIVR